MRNRFHYKPKHLSRRGRLKSITVLMVLAAFLVVTAAGQSGIAGKAAADSSSWDCGLEEHTHTAECYAEDGGTLICDIPEHTHTDMCLASDPSADVETADSWELALPDLTGVWSDDLVAVAESQLGYTESSANFIRADDGETRMGYTRYGAWYGDEYGGWDAMFVSFCLYYAGIPEETFPEAPDTPSLRDAVDEAGLYIYDTAFKPMAGDLVFFDTDENGQADRVGIITCLFDDNTMTVIEGDCEDAVAENAYGKDDGQIIGYGVLPENPDAESGTDDELSLIFEGDDYIVGVTYGPDAMLPDDVTLTAGEYGQDSDTYVSRCEEAADFYGWDEDEEDREIRLFDIGLYTQGENGELFEIEPAAPVEVTILYLEDNTDEEHDGIYTVTHFGDEIETVASETAAGGSGEAIMFRLDSFSDIMVMAGNAGDSSTQYVILNTGNENGSYSDNQGYYPWVPIAGLYGAGYSAGYGDDWRITVAIPATDFHDGQMTISLPGDDDLPENDSERRTFTICDDVSVSLAKENVSYDYRLVGWINVGTGEYTSVRDGSAEVTISADDDNIFYADWEAATYDVGQPDEHAEETVSTGSFVNISMFDYNELFNLYSVENTADNGEYTLQSGADSKKEYWEIPSSLLPNGIFYTTPAGSEDREQLDDIGGFLFYDTAATLGGNGFLGLPGGRTYQLYGSVGYGSNDGNRVNISRYLNATEWDSPFFTDYLFNTNAEEDGVVGVHYVGSGDQLFKYGTEEDELAVDEDYVGYYYYDSRYNAANYNQSEERFYVYDEASNVQDASYKEGFFPYNTYSDTLKKGDGSVNYFFGMAMDVDFYLPNIVGRENGNIVSGKDMTFNFSGDDDIWIFVDDTLVLDMSGVHNKSYGSINFRTGDVELQTTDTSGNIEYSEVIGNISGLASGNHTLRVYYLERGGNSSNLIVSFNIAPSWEYESDAVGAVTVKKQWQDSEGNLLTGEETENCPEVTMGLFEKVEAVTGSENTENANIYRDSDGNYWYRECSYDDETGTWVAGQWYRIDSDYYARDDNGNILAYYDYDTAPEEVDVLVKLSADLYPELENPVTLRYDPSDDSHYGWSCTWEFLDREKVDNGDYIVKEISASSVYTLVSEERDPDEGCNSGYEYWSIIGETEIEDWLKDGHENESDKYSVILTDAASNSFETVYGWALYVDDSSGEAQIKSQKLTFSMHAEESTNEGSTAGHEITVGKYGVISNTEVSACDPGVIWYLEFAEKDTEDDLDIFYICYDVVNSTTGVTTTYYLAVDTSGDEPKVVLSKDRQENTDAGYYDEFYCDEFGEIRLFHNTLRLVFSADDNGATVSVEQIDQEHYETDNIKIYTLDNEEGPYYSYLFVNRLRPVIVEKVDSRSTEDSTTYLDGATFILSKTVTEDGLDPVTYYWSENGWTTDIEDALTMVTGDIKLDLDGDNEPETTFRGAIALPYLDDGTYTLTETAAPDGYLLLPSAVTITVKGGSVISADWADPESVGSSYNGFIEISDSGLTVVLKNLQEYYELPSAGGPGVTWFYMAGGLLMAGGGLLMWRRLRRARC